MVDGRQFGIFVKLTFMLDKTKTTLAGGKSPWEGAGMFVIPAKAGIQDGYFVLNIFAAAGSQGASFWFFSAQA